MSAARRGRGAVVAIGVFDGVHLGHARILQAALDRAVRAPGTAGGRAPAGAPDRCVVVTFDPDPDLVLRHEFRAPAPLTPLPEKRGRIAALGVGEVEVLPFTRELAALEPEAFVQRHLVRPFGLRTLVVGEGFALGRGRAGTVERLRAIGAVEGFEVMAVPLLDLDGAPVSSTRIRGLLEQGRVAEAARLLGRRYDLEGRVVGGEAIGRTLGYPTANLRLHDEKLLPRDGVYAGWARLADGDEPLPAALSIGMRPTFDGTARAIEAHLLDWEGELLGRPVRVELVDWLRGQERFESNQALIAAMDRDCAEVRRRLGAGPAPRGSDPGPPQRP